MKKFLFACLLLCSFGSSATWLNTTGKVKNITTYAGKDTILVNLDTPGAVVQTCSSQETFAISSTISAEQRTRMFSILLAAQTAGRGVTVTYSNVGGCEAWNSNSNAFRKILRLSLQ